ncbi:unnamed protein product, partial [Polarella glacialis]
MGAHASQAPRIPSPAPGGSLGSPSASKSGIGPPAAVAKMAVAKVAVVAKVAPALASIPPKTSAPAVTKAAPAASTPAAPPKAAAAPKAVVKSAPKAPPVEASEDAEGQAMASPPASPPSDDALYILVAEFVEDPVVQDGELRDARLAEVFKRLWDGIARKPKDWVAAWQSMGIPVEKQAEALQKLLNFTFVQTEDPERAPAIVAELVKNHRIKMRSVEEVLTNFGHNLDGLLALNEEAWHVYAKFLVHVYPKPLAAGWGWSRVGWSWMS